MVSPLASPFFFSHVQEFGSSSDNLKSQLTNRRLGDCDEAED
jgi:hypothetical protein